MRIGIIDLGTNSVRFDVYDVFNPSQPQQIHREKRSVRLGDGLFQTGTLHESAIARTLEAFDEFRKISDQLQVGQIAAVATSAVREAANGLELVQAIHSRTAISVRPIPGEEEAALIAEGILYNEPIRNERFALVDIGGGSTEVSVCNKQEILDSVSFQLGGLRLQELALRQSPPKAAAIVELKKMIQREIAAHVNSAEWIQGVNTIVGSSGTIVSLVQLSRAHGLAGPAAPVKHQALTTTVDHLAKLTREEILRIPDMEPMRVDNILAGGILLDELAKALKPQEIVATDFSLRDGLLHRELRHASTAATEPLIK